VLCYAVMTFGEYGHVGSMLALLGENPPEDLRHSLSNETQVTAETPPAFLWHTANDGGVPVENSLLFAGALSKHKVPFALHVFPNGAHGLALAEGDPEVSQWTGLCAKWLKGLGF
jgi:dipeptidyl aminopeptidase/acylaminoacyl peptidase